MTALSFKGEIPGWGYLLQIITRAALRSRGEIPGRSYPLQIKYQSGATPYGRIAGLCYPLGSIYLGGPIPLGPITRTALPSRGQIPGRCYPLGAEYLVGSIPYGPNTRAALPFRGEIPERRYPRWPNTRPVFSLRGKYQGCATPSRSNSAALLFPRCEIPKAALRNSNKTPGRRRAYGQIQGRRFPLGSKY